LPPSLDRCTVHSRLAHSYLFWPQLVSRLGWSTNSLHAVSVSRQGSMERLPCITFD
jgi:hypothetical protein